MAGLEVLHRLHAIVNNDDAAIDRCDDVYGKESSDDVDLENHFYTTNSSYGVVIEDIQVHRQYVDIWTHLAPYVYFGHNGDPVTVITSREFRKMYTMLRKRSCDVFQKETTECVDLEIELDNGHYLTVKTVYKDGHDVHCRFTRDALNGDEETKKKIVCAILNGIQTHFYEMATVSRNSHCFQIMQIKPGVVHMSDDPSNLQYVCLRAAYDLARVDLRRGASITTTSGQLGARILQAMDESKQ